MGLFNNSVRRVLSLILCFIELLAFSGIHYGYNSLTPLFINDKIYNLCNSSLNVTNCEPQRNMFSSAFIAWTSVQMICTLPIGIVFDRVGLRFTKLSCAVGFLLGCLMFAFTTEDRSWLIFPAGCFIAVASQALIVCNLQVSAMFPLWRSLVVSFFCGAYDSSSAVFSLFEVGYKAGISLRISFLLLGTIGCSLMLFTGSAFFTKFAAGMANYAPSVRTEEEKSVADGKPLMMLEVNGNDKLEGDTATKEDPSEVTAQNGKRSLAASLTSLAHIPKGDSNSAAQADLERIRLAFYPNLLSCFVSRVYLCHVLFFSLGLLRFTFFFAQLGPLVTHLFGAQSDTSIRIFSYGSYIFLGGVLVAPMAGLIMDNLRGQIGRRKMLPGTSSPLTDAVIYWRSMLHLTAPIFICCVSMVFLSCLVFVAEEACFYIVCVCLVFTRAFLFSSNGAYLLTGFPVQYFGQLFGANMSIGGLVSCLQYALLKLSTQIANGVMFVVVVLAFSHPIQLLIVRK